MLLSKCSRFGYRVMLYTDMTAILFNLVFIVNMWLDLHYTSTRTTICTVIWLGCSVALIYPIKTAYRALKSDRVSRKDIAELEVFAKRIRSKENT